MSCIIKGLLDVFFLCSSGAMGEKVRDSVLFYWFVKFLVFLPVVLWIPYVQTSNIRNTKHDTSEKRQFTIKILHRYITVVHPDILTTVCHVTPARALSLVRTVSRQCNIHRKWLPVLVWVSSLFSVNCFYLFY